MKAVVYTQNGLPIDDPHSLFDMELPRPVPGPRDLLVAIRAISVNPADTQMRAKQPTTAPRILGWDAVGEVVGTGSEVSLFKVGDVVYYAGSMLRPGTYAEFGLVDERIAGHKPPTLSDAEAAALPLTTLTAWELLFDRLGVVEGGHRGETLLILGAGGGVGSVLVQLARELTELTVVGTASNPETADWVKDRGSHHVLDYRKPLRPQLEAVGIPHARYVAGLTHTQHYYPQIVDLVAPQGRFGLIDDPPFLDATPLKLKAVSLHWELMFTRSMFETDDMDRQHAILERAASLVTEGKLRTTLSQNFGVINAANLRRAHALVESGKSRGKIALEGF